MPGMGQAGSQAVPASKKALVKSPVSPMARQAALATLQHVFATPIGGTTSQSVAGSRQ
jgi:hypothetical protein